MIIEYIQEKNSHIRIHSIEADTFRPYGRVLTQYDFSPLIRYMEENIQIPTEGNIYVASDEQMERMDVFDQLQQAFYGEMPIQIGYCNGKNSTLNGLEYHKASEINVAVTDLVLLLGKVQDIDQNQYESKKVEAFYIPKGTAVELYGTTLHFAPCKVEAEGFKAVVILPRETNLGIESRDRQQGEDQLLFAKNKWLLVHPSRKVLVERGAHIGIIGENIEIK